MSASPQRVGLIGLSAKGCWATSTHLPYLTNTPLYTLTALQNSTKAAAEASAAKYSLPTVSTHGDPTSLAADPTVDIVAVSVNVPEHYKLIKAALAAKKDVFSEWPLSANATDAAELTALAKAQGVRTLVGLQARQSPTIIKAKALVASGRLGTILGTTMYGHGTIFDATSTESRAYMLPIEAGANLLTIPCGHAVDALAFVLGEMESLSATLANAFPEVSVREGADVAGKEVRKAKKTAHDYVSVTGTLVSGGVVDVTYAAGSSRTGRNFYWEINGTEGSLVLEAATGFIEIENPSLKFVGSEPGAKLEVVEVEEPTNVASAWDVWAGVGAEKGHTVTTFEDALVRHQMIEAIYRSAEKGTRESYL